MWRSPLSQQLDKTSPRLHLSILLHTVDYSPANLESPHFRREFSEAMRVRVASLTEPIQLSRVELVDVELEERAPALDIPAPALDIPAPALDIPAPALDIPAPALDTPAPAPSAE